MIELPHIDHLPVVEVVALLARRAQAPFVWILMASPASSRQPKVGSVQVFDLYRGTVLRSNLRRIVAAVASKPGVLALKNVSGLFMIEALAVPLDQRKVFPVVLRVTTCALLARSRRDIVRRMQSLAGSKAGRNLRVAFETL